MTAPPDPTIHFGDFLDHSESRNGPKKLCPNRRPVELSAGLQLKPADILLKLELTVVSRDEIGQFGRNVAILNGSDSFSD